MNRIEMAEHICKRIGAEREACQAEFARAPISSFVVDDVLPVEVAEAIFRAFPNKRAMRHRSDIREDKYVSAQMDRHSPLLEEAIYAFQAPEVVQLISELTHIRDLRPDASLYAGGLSLMPRGSFLNPHTDNSHDANQKDYRVLNLLYYVTPEWKEEYGGNLELWDEGMRRPPRVIWSKFNRLVVMLTHRSSYHSVNRVTHDGQRCCVSNYYFSPHSIEGKDYFHTTSFRGRPEEKLRDLVLRADAAVRTALLKVLPYRSFHIYKRPSDSAQKR